MNQHDLRKTIFRTAILAAIVCLGACASSQLEGTYTDSRGVFKLELKGGGKATLTTPNNPTDCTYKVDGKQLTVRCENQIIPFTIQDDGSLAGPPEAHMEPLRKTKS